MSFRIGVPLILFLHNSHTYTIVKRLQLKWSPISFGPWLFWAPRNLDLKIFRALISQGPHFLEPKKWVAQLRSGTISVTTLLNGLKRFWTHIGQIKVFCQTSVLPLILKRLFCLHNWPYLLTLVNLTTQSVFIIIFQVFVTTKDTKDEVNPYSLFLPCIFGIC